MHRSAAFSLVELVIVVIILGIIAAIAAPRMTRASRSAQANALRATTVTVRKAIDHYYAEHGQFPGLDAGTGSPSGTAFVDQLTKYSDRNGNVVNSPDATHLYGPYLRSPFPTNPFNSLSTVTVRLTKATIVAPGASGWIATLSDGAFQINAHEADLDTIGAAADPIVGQWEATELPEH